MRAVRSIQSSEGERLEVVDAPVPTPGPTQLLVRNFATALNRADLLQRRGLYPPPPGVTDVLGLEFAGEVAERGGEASDYRVGDRVFGLVPGGAYADFLVVDHRVVLPVPDTFSFDAAAACPEAFTTASECLLELGGLAAGQWALIHAGASGVGSAAVQLVRAVGAMSLVTVGSAQKARAALQWGATRAVLYREEDFAQAAAEVTGGVGVDIVLDVIGASYWERNLASLRDGGRLLVVGLLGGPKVTCHLGVVLLRRLQIIGNALRARSLEDRIGITRRFRERVLPLLEGGTVRPIIDRVLPIEEVREAHALMEANANLGKIVLRL